MLLKNPPSKEKRKIDWTSSRYFFLFFFKSTVPQGMRFGCYELHSVKCVLYSNSQSCLCDFNKVFFFYPDLILIIHNVCSNRCSSAMILDAFLTWVYALPTYFYKIPVQLTFTSIKLNLEAEVYHINKNPEGKSSWSKDVYSKWVGVQSDESSILKLNFSRAFSQW